MARRPTDIDGGPEAEEVAAYVAAMAVELKELVDPFKMQALSYLLDLVKLEAEQRARGGEGGQVVGPGRAP